MAITETTIKRLFAKSQNVCAMPRCKAALVIGDTVLAEICHIRARRKGGARFDPSLTAEEKDSFGNLIILCPTCHTLVDKARVTYTVPLLEEIKEMHERAAPMEISPSVARQASLIYEAKFTRRRATITDSPVQGGTQASARGRGIAVAIGGHNQGDITIKVPSSKKTSGTQYPPNSIGADANMTNYVDYLCDLYVKYMVPITTDEGQLWGKLGRHIKNKFRLRKRTRNHLSAERFPDLVDYLINEKLANTPVGKRHLRNGTKLCRTFEEFRHEGM